ncbi:MAG TPA: hypothetical protein VFI92_04835 [Steroidobacteraceae bacterium]|nr:hypothetical protein [Steroidobacteraceae bacterium]
MALVSRNVFIVRRILAGVLAVVCVGSAAVANGQATLSEFSEQKLDRVDVIDRTGATNVAIDMDAETAVKPWVAADYEAVSGTTFTTCVNTSTLGMFCLDRNAIRHWPNPEKTPPLDAVDGQELFNCGNPVFAFDRDNICTALTLDLKGDFWIAGKKKSKFSLFKVVTGGCPSDPPNAVSRWTSFSTAAGTFCAREYASGRPLLIDLNVIDGDVAEVFPHSQWVGDELKGGVIGVEERKEVTFFKDIPQALPVVLGAGKVWGLGGGEQLQAATLLQKVWPDDSRTWLLVATSAGRLLSREIPWNSTVTPVINHTGLNLVSPPPSSCPLTTALYDIRASLKTHATFVSDRRACRLLSLQSNIDASSFTTTTPLAFTSSQLIASTSPSPSQPEVATLTAAPEGISIAPGIEVDLRAECGFDTEGNPLTCPIVPDGGDGNFVPAASLTGVRIDDGPSGLVVFEIQNIPDCRRLPFAVQPAACKDGAILAPDGRVIDDVNDPTEYSPDGMPLNPELLFLDVAELMPPEVTSVVTLPRMLISPRYMALDDTNTFGALFGVTDDLVRFRETFVGEFHLGDLIPGRKLGCGGETTIDTLTGPNLDILLTISERFTTVGGLPGGGRQHTDMLVNKTGCDPLDPPAAGTRWSLYGYGFKLAPERVQDPDTGEIEVRYPDSIFARLVLSLFQDLGATIDDYLCFDRDGGTGAPVSAATCTSLQESYDTTLDKLIKCVESSTEPMNSTEIRACQAFETQYLAFASLVGSLTPNALDPANRIGEGQARLLEVFRYIYDEQFKPSIPITGFIDGL